MAPTRFLGTWNGILCILFLGLYLMLPALKRVFTAGAAEALAVSQLQTLAGSLAVIWGLWAAWRKLGGDKDR